MTEGAEWLSAVTRELRGVSANLLDPGLTKGVSGQAVSSGGPMLRIVLSLVDRFCALVESVRDDLLSPEDSGEWDRGRTPRSAIFSRAPQDYGLQGNRLVPTVWLRSATAGVAVTPAARWLLGIGSKLDSLLQEQSVRITGQIEEASALREGSSVWAVEDRKVLSDITQGISRREYRLRRSMADLVQRHGNTRLTPSDQLPVPFPYGAAWQGLRALALSMSRRETLLGALLGDLLAEPILVADAPYLFQRWCGLRLIAALSGFGLKCSADPVPPLFLGGRLEFESARGLALTLWIEPRVGAKTAPILGWNTRSPERELTPDFLITCGRLGERDAFVVDATLSSLSEAVREKGRKYAGDMGLVGEDAALVAGVPLLRRPLRAWTMALSHRGRCDPMDGEGRVGLIPMDPLAIEDEPLRAWVADVVAHAQRIRLPRVSWQMPGRAAQGLQL